MPAARARFKAASLTEAVQICEQFRQSIEDNDNLVLSIRNISGDIWEYQLESKIPLSSVQTKDPFALSFSESVALFNAMHDHEQRKALIEEMRANIPAIYRAFYVADMYKLDDAAKLQVVLILLAPFLKVRLAADDER